MQPNTDSAIRAPVRSFLGGGGTDIDPDDIDDAAALERAGTASVERSPSPTPPPHPQPMPAQEIAFWTPLRLLIALLQTPCAFLGGGRRTPLARLRSSRAKARCRLAARRWLYLALVVATTATAAIRLWAILRVDGLSGLEVSLLALFVVLFGWIASSFWLAIFGTYARRRTRRERHLDPARPAIKRIPARRSRTAIVMPIHNEDPDRVFAGIDAVRQSVAQTDCGRAEFDFYVLSDSTDPSCLSAEEIAWRRRCGDGAPLFYRHRAPNLGRKSGNIADFCRNWGALYDYMVVLDADSLMTSETLVAMVAMMDAHPRTALIQAPPRLIGRESLFARTQQFASSVYGDIYAAGLAYLQEADGNYWGHNAIIRVQPFARHCGLPKLPGPMLFGGEILSHDFVEAALLRRAGWELHLAPELAGSFEEPPPTLIDHLKRDRRWCFGNLQHLALIGARGFAFPSRLHFVNGVMTYLSSPLWLVMLLLSSIEAFRIEAAAPVTYVGRYPLLTWPMPHALAFIALVVATLVLLYGPKLVCCVSLLRDRQACRAHGGGRRLALSVLAESAFSSLIAPIVMLSHSWFVVSFLLGRRVGWTVQRRCDGGLDWRTASRAFAPHTAIALAAAVAIWHYVPSALPWYGPLLAGPACAIPLCFASSTSLLGRAALRRRLFLVPSETVGLRVLDRMRERLAAPEIARVSRFDMPVSARPATQTRLAN
jgi:membrane glycosyltransferase